MAKTNLNPKVLVISNLRTTGPLWAMNLQQLGNLNVVFEPIAENALSRFAEVIPNLIIMDVNLPDAATINLIRSLRNETTNPILLLTPDTTEGIMLAAYEAGVDQCIHKPIGPSLFQAIVKVWLKHCWTVSVEFLNPIRVGKFQLDPSERIFILENGSPIRLTNLELRLLYCLMSQPGMSMKTEDLIERLWGNCYAGDSNTLKNVVYRLRKKIEPDPARQVIIQTDASVGYRFASPG